MALMPASLVLKTEQMALWEDKGQLPLVFLRQY